MNINIDQNELHNELVKLIVQKIRAREIRNCHLTLAELEECQKPLVLGGIQVENRRKEK